MCRVQQVDATARHGHVQPDATNNCCQVFHTPVLPAGRMPSVTTALNALNVENVNINQTSDFRRMAGININQILYKFIATDVT
jgi:hypothetical protein